MAHDFISVAKTGIQLVTSAASNDSALPLDSGGGVPRYIRVAATAAACVRLGKGAQTAVVTDLQVQPGDAVVIATQGADHIAAIQVAAAGVVQVSPLEQL